MKFIGIVWSVVTFVPQRLFNWLYDATERWDDMPDVEKNGISIRFASWVLFGAWALSAYITLRSWDLWMFFVVTAYIAIWLFVLGTIYVESWIVGPNRSVDVEMEGY